VYRRVSSVHFRVMSSLLLSDCHSNLNVSKKFGKASPIANFMKLLSLNHEFLLACKQTDRHGDANDICIQIYANIQCEGDEKFCIAVLLCIV
jgi:hypothetical protein